MRIVGNVLNIEGNKVVIQSENPVDVDAVEKHIVDGKIRASIDIIEKDSITQLQRSHIYALIGDMAEYEGYPDEVIKSFMKYKFMLEYNLDEFPSFADNMMKKSEASNLIEMMITYCVQNEIPFRKNQWYLTADNSKIIYALVMKRLCVVCGKPHSDMHHATNLVGMGNDRKKHNHLESKFLSLCREHHNEAHSMGLEEFCKKYVVKPVRLDEDELKELNII